MVGRLLQSVVAQFLLFMVVCTIYRPSRAGQSNCLYELLPNQNGNTPELEFENAMTFATTNPVTKHMVSQADVYAAAGARKAELIRMTTLEARDIGLIESYTSSFTSKRINNALRAGGSSQEGVEILQAMEHLPNYSGIVVRTESEPGPELGKILKRPENPIVFKSFLSTSLSLKSYGYLPQSDPHGPKLRYVIYAKTGKEVWPFTPYAPEFEVVIRPGSQFKVLKILERPCMAIAKPPCYEIHLYEIDRK